MKGKERVRKLMHVGSFNRGSNERTDVLSNNKESLWNVIQRLQLVHTKCPHIQLRPVYIYVSTVLDKTKAHTSCKQTVYDSHLTH